MDSHGTGSGRQRQSRSSLPRIPERPDAEELSSVDEGAEVKANGAGRGKSISAKRTNRTCPTGRVLQASALREKKTGDPLMKEQFVLKTPERCPACGLLTSEHSMEHPDQKWDHVQLTFGLHLFICPACFSAMVNPNYKEGVEYGKKLMEEQRRKGIFGAGGTSLDPSGKLVQIGARN